MSRAVITANEINELFDQYAAALEKNDAKAMAMLYALPCTFLSNDGSSVYSDLAPLEGAISQGRRFYKKYGIVAAAPDVRNKYSITDKIVRVKVNWRYLDKDHRDVYNCDYEYIVKQQIDGEWKIEMAISINEKEQLEQLQK
ncbi:MAG: hypothetical protein R2800_04815 [Flavipsychrobacter sp.]